MLLRSTGRALVESSAVGGSTASALRQSPRRGVTTEDVRRGRPIDKIDPMVLRQGKRIRTTDARTEGHGRGAAAPDGQKKLLTPYVLSQRIQALCDKGELTEAIAKLKESPRDAQNPAVWGTLINAVMTAGKYKEAYRLFTDMKRRGFTPTTRTYTTLLGGYSNIEDWEKYSVQLDNVYSLFDQLQRYHADIKRSDPRSAQLSEIPYTQLIKIFGQAQQFQRMYDVFNSMPSEGPLAPSIHTYTALLSAIGIRKASALAPSVSIFQMDEEEPTKEPSYNELMFKNATDARLIWRQLLQASAKNPGLQIDSHALRALLKILSRGRPSDQNFAFDIVYEYFGLAKPGQPPIPPKVELHPLTLQALLIACNNAKRYNLTVHYAQQVIDSDSGTGPGEHPLGLRRMLDARHMNIVLEAYASRASFGSSEESEEALETLEWMLRMQAISPLPGKDGGIGPQIRPTVTTYDLVALTCWRSADWPRACKVFQLMTGYDPADFRGVMHKQPQQEKRSKGRNIVPTPNFMASFIKAASKTHDAGNMQQALNIFEHYGADTFFKFDHPPKRMSPKEQKERKDMMHFAGKLAQALAHNLHALLKLPNFDDATRARWGALQRRAELRLRSDPPEED